MIVPNEKEIKSILKNKNMILKSLRTKRCEIYRELMDKEDFMRAILLHTPQMAQANNKGAGYKDVVDEMQNYEKQSRKYVSELRTLLKEITKKEAVVRKVWYCFSRLPEPYYTYLHALYVDQLPYKDVLKRSGCSNSIFARRRKKAMEMLQNLYSQTPNDDPWYLTNLKDTPEITY